MFVFKAMLHESNDLGLNLKPPKSRISFQVSFQLKELKYACSPPKKQRHETCCSVFSKEVYRIDGPEPLGHSLGLGRLDNQHLTLSLTSALGACI